MPESEAVAVETAPGAEVAEVKAATETAGERDEPRSIDELAAKFSEGMEAKPAEAEPETAPPEKEPDKAPDKAKVETPAFDPKAEGLPEAYWQCKSAGEVAQLAEKRRSDAEALAKAHDDELGALRKKVQEAEKPPEKPAEAEPAEWTEEQRAEYQRVRDEKPEVALAWEADVIRKPLLEKIATLETRLAAVEGKAENIVKETLAEKDAREMQGANQEWEGFIKDHPDAPKMRTDGVMEKTFKAVNEGRPTGEVNDIYGDIYSLAKLADSDKELHPEVLKHMRKGYRFAEAAEMAGAMRAKGKYDKAEQARKVEEAKRTGRIAGPGKGAGSPGTGAVTETDLSTYLVRRGHVTP